MVKIVSRSGLTGREKFTIAGLAAGLKRGQKLTVRAELEGKVTEFETLARVDTPDDVEFIKHGGILPLTLRELLQSLSGQCIRRKRYQI